MSSTNAFLSPEKREVGAGKTWLAATRSSFRDERQRAKTASPVTAQDHKALQCNKRSMNVCVCTHEDVNVFAGFTISSQSSNHMMHNQSETDDKKKS